MQGMTRAPGTCGGAKEAMDVDARGTALFLDAGFRRLDGSKRL